MNDYISREYLLDVLLPHSWHGTNKNIVPYNDRRGYRQRDREVREVIINAPRADVRENRWIPVSERLPQDGKYVLFCDIDDDIMIGYHVKGRPVTHFSQDGTYEDMKNVRAWMPLPEPYQKGGE